MSLQITNLTNKAQTITSPAYTFKPFESRVFTGPYPVTAELQQMDLLKVLQVESIGSVPRPVLYNHDTGLFSTDEAEVIVSGAGITYAEAAAVSGVTPGERRTLSDGPDAGAQLIWSIPEGSTTYAWCWAIYPLASYL